jgi:hypothetical protein
LTIVVGRAFFNTAILLVSLSYRSECSNSVCSSLSEVESSSEMRVRGVVPPRRLYSAAMQEYSAAAFSQILPWISLT